MNNAQQRAISGKAFLFVAIWYIAFVFAGCEDPGLVGGGVSDSDASIRVDTMAIENVNGEPYDNFYSGNLNYFSVGQFNDPLFGDLEATGLIRPALPDANLNPEVASDASLSLRLNIQPGLVYGDSMQTAEFDVVELDQQWRGKAWKLHDQVQLSGDGLLASFSVERRDTLKDIELPRSWSDDYLQYYLSEDAGRDSLYRINFPGLAIVPRNAEKIIAIDAQASGFLIVNPQSDSLSTDTVSVIAKDWAYSLNRSNVSSAPAGTYKMHSTLEQAFSFDMDVSKEALGTTNISRVELVFYEDTEDLESSLDQVSPYASRPKINTAWLYFNKSEHLPTLLNPSLGIRAAVHNKEDGSYRFNITNFAQTFLTSGINPELKFYVALESNNGIVRSSLFYNNEAPEAKKPKLIVTSVENK